VKCEQDLIRTVRALERRHQIKLSSSSSSLLSPVSRRLLHWSALTTRPMHTGITYRQTDTARSPLTGCFVSRLILGGSVRFVLRDDRQPRRRLRANSHHHARHDKTVSSVSRPIRRGVNWIPDNSRVSPTENLKSEHVYGNGPIHTATPDTTQTRPSCRVWCGGVN